VAVLGAPLLTAFDETMFHHFTVFVDGERVPIFVWHGVKQFRNEPSSGVLAYLASLANPAKHRLMMVQLKRLRNLSIILKQLPDEFGAFMFWVKERQNVPSRGRRNEVAVCL
jgi:hypothetical protein